MKVLLCTAVVLGGVGALCFVGFAVSWRWLVAIPDSFEVTDTPDEGDAGGDVDAQTATVG